VEFQLKVITDILKSAKNAAKVFLLNEREVRRNFKTYQPHPCVNILSAEYMFLFTFDTRTNFHIKLFFQTIGGL
jgi:hypothetical protein